MSKIPATKTEEPYFKYCYGKWIRVGVIKQETEPKKKPKD